MSETIKLNLCPKCQAPIPSTAPQGLCPKCVLAGAATPTESGVPPTATAEIPTIPRIAAAFPQLEILELIGRGGMGFVFKARQPHLDRFVALKLLPDKLAKDPHFAERFNREGRFLAKLNHPNIVSVFDFGQTGGFYFLLMEYVDGVNLRQAMRAGRFSPAEALSIVPKICEALQYAHEQGVLHRDIKPENILLDAKGRVKIADFGIAKLVGEEAHPFGLTATGAALGTPHYMAPEQLERPGDVDHRADIYSLGVVFYEMLTGELPIGRFAAPSSKTPIDQRVDAIVFRALEKERELRQKNVRELKTQVEQVTSAHSPKESAGTKPTIVAAPAWVRPVGILFLGLGALALPPTFASFGTSHFVLNWFVLLMLTGIALLTRNYVCRWAAIGANVIGLLLPWLSAFNVATGVQNGALSLDWRPAFMGLPNSAGLAILFALLESSAFAAALFVLLRSDVTKLFTSAGSFKSDSAPPKVHAGESGTIVVNPSAVQPTISSWSLKAIWGAALVAISLVPITAFLVVIAYFAASRGGPMVASAILSLPAIAGTILGWMALNDIRIERLRGLPLAVFAALAWPLLLLICGTLVIPSFIAFRDSPSSASSHFAAVLAMLIPAGVVTFAIWSVYATVHWGSNQPITRRRGVLKWIFLGLVLFGFAVLITSRLGPARQTRFVNNASFSVPIDTNTIPPAFRDDRTHEAIRIRFRVAKGQVATFQVVRRDVVPMSRRDTDPIPVTVPAFAGFFSAPDDERARGELLLMPTRPPGSMTNARAWTMSIAADDGPRSTGERVDLGELISAIQSPPDNFYEVRSDSESEIYLTQAWPAGVQSSPAPPRPSLSLIVRSEARARQLAIPQEGIAVSTGSTNWLKALKSLPQSSIKPPNTNAWIRFTFTSVEVRHENGGRWLAIDYLDDVHGDCERAFRWEVIVPGFTGKSRTAEFVAHPQGSPPVRHQRVEFRLPDSLTEEEAQRFRDELAKALVAQSVLAHAGEEMPLFKLPLSNGALGAWVGAIGSDKSP